MEGQLELSELPDISWVSAFQECLLSGVSTVLRQQKEPIPDVQEDVEQETKREYQLDDGEYSSIDHPPGI